MMKIYSLLLLSFYLLSCSGQKTPKLKTNSGNNTLLWQVSGNGLTRPSYLFGTFHLLCKEDIHFSEQLKKAMKASDEVYLELKMDDPATLLGGMLYMNMKDGKSLKDLYSAADYKRIEAYFTDSLHTPLMLLGKMKPELLVSLLYPKMMDCKFPSGVEEELMKLTKEYKKEIKGLETVQFQAAIFDSIPYSVQAKDLLDNIDSFQTNKAQFNVMLSTYKKQLLDSLSENIVNDKETKDYSAILVTNRNKNWVGQLKDIMKNHAVFVAVGAGHLPGTDGLIDLLRKQGYTLTPLNNR